MLIYRDTKDIMEKTHKYMQTTKGKHNKLRNLYGKLAKK